MVCMKCGHEIVEGAVFCPFCGEKIVQGEQGGDAPVYQVDVKKVWKSGKLVVYRDRTEFVTSSVQKAIFSYMGLVAVKKEWDHIDFITEDGRTEVCPADRKCVHEAFLYIEQMARPYLAQRRERLSSLGVRYSFVSSQGILNDGVLNISDEQVEFKAKSGKSDVISFQDVKSVNASVGTLDFVLFGGRTKSFTIGKEIRDEVLAFVKGAVAPYLEQRREALLARGIYFSSLGLNGGVLDILADRVEYKNQSGQVETVSFQDVRTASLYAGTLELALTDGTSRSFPVEEDIGGEILAFIKKAIEPYVLSRTVGFDTVFGIDEKIEINEERAVFHIIRQSGREITDEWPVDALSRCEWKEQTELSTLGSVVSGGIAFIKSAAKAAGSQTAAETEERISCAGVVLTVCKDQAVESQKVWFGIFPTGMSKLNKKYDRYLAEWTRLSEYLQDRCPECELIEPVLPEPESDLTEIAALNVSDASETFEIATPDGRAENAVGFSEFAARQDDLGIARYIEGVSKFIDSCATPMTIAFQGNRGSGENSVFRILFNRLGEQYRNNLFWINTRQFPQGKSGESLAILVGRKLVGLLNGEGNAMAKERTEKIITNLAGLVAGAISSDSSIGKDMMDGLLNRGSADTLEQVMELFSRKIEAMSQDGNGKVVLFIDGLDRFTPARAVEILEALRDFFECKGCVFVIAADYSTILSGVQELYGQSFDENRGKRFVDEMFKMSFRVPASGYNVLNYVKSKLEQMDVRAEDEAETGIYAALIQNSVGIDPESIDRLFSSFLLLKNMADEEMYKNRYKRLALFALLCMQMRFREVYDYAVRMKDHMTKEFLAGLCGVSSLFESREHVSDSEKTAFQNFGNVFAQIIDLDGETEISEAECWAFTEVLEVSSITSK